jgi:glycosyltransferase involved in cell wall biosynthesis
MRIKNRVYFKHGLVYETQFGLLKKILIFIDYLTDFLATKIICVSESVLRKSLEIPFCRKSKYFIPAKGTCNGIDSMNKFNPDLIDSNEITVLKNHLGISSETIVIGFIGRLAKDKGVKELVSSLKYLDTLNSNLRLLLVGPVDERDPIINLELDLITDIIRVDFVENTELYYSLMDIFILPSYREGFPTVNLEAASMRLPVVTTKSTGCIDSIVENETGIYTDIDGQSIANALNFYLKNPSIRIEHGKNGRKHVLKNYNQENVWNAISNIYFNS